MLSQRVFDDGIAFLEGLYGNLAAEKLVLYHRLLEYESDGAFIAACYRVGKTFRPHYHGHFPEVADIIEAIADERKGAAWKADAPSASAPAHCSHCSDGLIALHGLWNQATGWGQSVLRACWCEMGKRRVEHWETALYQTTADEVRENRDAYEASWRAYRETKGAELDDTPMIDVREAIRSIAAKVEKEDERRKLRERAEPEPEPEYLDIPPDMDDIPI